ncbi:cobalamin biosynthesis protein [Actinomadura rubrisoli]|uniref:Cobalamin biosynthesis protein n=1 Tax=Actinomadura rubrisoli TaxID=2530368 RepID=A0A4R5A8Q6_9ACTN|nr:cobalamin biosynthesis protein [Actinomadura rubrisoli]TDD67239.1 cobalamin biosynthesis protein [Actinomadura rubrisoli]
MTEVVIGVGASSGASAAEIGALIGAVLEEAGLAPEAVRCVATADGRAGERVVRAAARDGGFPLIAYPVDVLAQVEVPNPAEATRARTGTASVAEAAALHAARPLGGAPELIVQKRRSARATAAVAWIGPPGPDGPESLGKSLPKGHGGA